MCFDIARIMIIFNEECMVCCTRLLGSALGDQRQNNCRQTKKTEDYKDSWYYVWVRVMEGKYTCIRYKKLKVSYDICK